MGSRRQPQVEGEITESRQPRPGPDQGACSTRPPRMWRLQRVTLEAEDLPRLHPRFQESGRHRKRKNFPHVKGDVAK